MNSRSLVTLLVLGTVWGASFLFIKVVVEETSPLVLVEGRMLFGALAVLTIMAARRLPFSRSSRLWAKVAIMAVMSNVVPFLLVSWGEIHIESGTASVLNSTMPLFTALFTTLFLADERLSAAKLVGLLVGFLGVVVLTGDDILDVTDSSILGQLAVVAAAACYGLGAVYARVLLRSEEALSLSGLQLVVGVLILAPALFAVERPPDLSLSIEAWLSLITLGILGTGLAYVAYLWLLERVGTVRTSLVTYVVPITGLLLGWAVLDESVGLNTLLACGLIITGVGVVVRGGAPAPLPRITPARGPSVVQSLTSDPAD